VPRRQARQAEEGDPSWQRRELGVDEQRVARSVQALRRTGAPDPHAQRSPQLGLPAVVVAAGVPVVEQLGAVDRVAVIQRGQVCNDAEPSRAITAAATEVRVHLRQPRLCKVLVDGLQQRPDEALGQPRVAVGVEARRGRDDLVDQPPWLRKDDVGAHAVGTRADAQRARQLLGHPAFNTARGHGHYLGGKWVARRLDEDARERADETVRAIGAMDV
jgi:hypothetical protein